MAIGTDGSEECWVQQAVRYRNNSFFFYFIGKTAFGVLLN